MKKQSLEWTLRLRSGDIGEREGRHPNPNKIVTIFFLLLCRVTYKRVYTNTLAAPLPFTFNTFGVFFKDNIFATPPSCSLFLFFFCLALLCNERCNFLGAKSFQCVCVTYIFFLLTFLPFYLFRSLFFGVIANRSQYSVSKNCPSPLYNPLNVLYMNLYVWMYLNTFIKISYYKLL